MSRRPDEFPPQSVVVIDTSALIEFKRLVSVGSQWQLLMHMTRLVEAGRLCFPRQVAREIEAARHPDAPGAWAAHCKGHTRHPQPRDDALAEVLAMAPLLVDVQAENENADPYVAAMAWEIRERHQPIQVVVATNDFVDRPPVKESLAGACRKLGIDTWRPDAFVDWLSTAAKAA